jgi:hypothetical protein
MAVVVGGVVDQDVHRAPVGAQAGHRGLRAVDIGEVLMDEPHGVPSALEAGEQRLRGLGLHVDEGHPRSLRGERRDDELADAAAAAGDEDPFVAQRRILRVPSRTRSLPGVSL